MRIIIGGDHAGFHLKSHLLPYLEDKGHKVTDIGAFSEAPVDFPDVAKALCEQLLERTAARGVMCCGTGVGAAIACNKIRGIRAALCHDTHCAHQCVEHDNVNVLALGHWIIGQNLAEEIVTAFTEAKFEDNEDFHRRVAKLEELAEWGRSRS